MQLPKRDTVVFKAILKFCTTKKLCKYLQRKYIEQQIAVLNKVVRIRGKIRTFKFSTVFLKACRSNRVAPKYMIARNERSKIRHSLVVERAFINDKIEKQTKQLKKLYVSFRSLVGVACQFLSFFDKIGFYRYLAMIEEKTSMKIHNRNKSLLATLKKKRFGNMLSCTKKHIFNFSNHVLSDVESFVLSHGLNFCLAPKSICREEVFAEFELLWAQLDHHRALPENEQSSLKARLTDLAHLYCGEEINSRDFAFHGECFRALNSLHSNENIVITKPDKGSGVVIPNKNDFIDKMQVILDDPSKFVKLGPASSNDKIANIESKLLKRLLELFKEDSIPKSLYQNIRPTGSQRPRMYGLPKAHKTNVPLRPILSMTGSSHHELSKWLTSLLQPVLKRFWTRAYVTHLRLLMLFTT